LEPLHLGSPRIHAPGRDAAAQDARDRLRQPRRRAGDRDRAREEERADPAAQLARSARVRHDRRIIPHEKPIEIRWRDIDNFGHVNNAVYLTYLEEARDEWVELAVGREKSWGFVLARVAIDYRRELTQSDDVVLARCTLAGLGTSSVRTREELVTRDGELSAEAEAVIVARDPETGRSRPLTDEERAAFERTA
jgi:acyl-CoA thioester hydrolase